MVKNKTTSFYFAALLLTASLAASPTAMASEPVPTLSSTQPTSQLNNPTAAADPFPTEVIQWQVSKVKAKDLTASSIPQYANYLKTSGNHLIIYGLDLQDKITLLDLLFPSHQKLFRVDLSSLASKDQGGNVKDNVVLPTFISIANVNGFLQVAYGTVIINPSVHGKDQLLSNLKKKSYEPRKNLENQIETDVTYFVDRYETERQQWLSQGLTPSPDPAATTLTQRLLSHQAYYYDNEATFSLAGKVENSWLIYQGITADSQVTYSIQANIKVTNGYKTNYSPYTIDQFRTSWMLLNEKDQLVSGQPVAKGQRMAGNYWPSNGTETLLDAQTIPGSKGSYTYMLQAQKYQESLPDFFQIPVSAMFTSKDSSTSVEVQQWFRSLSIRNSATEFFSINEILRND